jgi:hypothetical protein
MHDYEFAMESLGRPFAEMSHRTGRQQKNAMT